jgi:hypothetical protein
MSGGVQSGATSAAVVDPAAATRELDENQRALKGRVDSSAKKQSAALKSRLAGGILATCTRSTLNRRIKSARLYEHLPGR